MRVISLTSIPTRFDQLGPTLESLLAQKADGVFLCLPRVYRRFGAFDAPAVPNGVTLLWSDRDYGPATKVLPAAARLKGSNARLVYCDDDWIYAPGWLDALLQIDGAVVAASGFRVDRLKRHSESGAGDVDIAQGFAGVAIKPDDMDFAAIDVPDLAFAVDDIWLSGHFAKLRLPITLNPAARRLCQSRTLDAGLQNDTVFGKSRAEANLACLNELTGRYGIWPPR